MERSLEEVHPSLPRKEQRRQIRETAGLSRSRLAFLVGVSPESIYNWEKGGEPQGLQRAAYSRVLVDLSRAAEEKGGA